MSKHRNPRPKVPKPPSADNQPRRLTKTALVGVEDALGDLRHLIAKVAASVYATEDLFEKFIWDDRTDERDEDRRIEHLCALMVATRTSVMEAIEAGEEISGDLIRLRTARRGVRP